MFMSLFRLLVCLVMSFLLVSSTALAEKTQALPTGGTPVIEAASLAPDKLNVNTGKNLATKKINSKSSLESSPSIIVNITGQPKNTWDISVNKSTDAAVKKGDALVAGFWVRGKAGSGDSGGVTEFVFEEAGDPYTKSIQYLVETPADGTWKHYWVAFKSLGDYEAGGSVITFQMGYLKQEVELAKIELWNFGQRELSGLPHTPLSYIGREPEAPWRKEALRRIEKVRKADLEIQVVASNGQPLSGQSVHVQLDRHAFGFGTAVNSWKVTGKEADDEKYREVLKENFNMGAIENGLKWPFWDEKPKVSKVYDRNPQVASKGEHQSPWTRDDMAGAGASARLGEIA